MTFKRETSILLSKLCGFFMKTFMPISLFNPCGGRTVVRETAARVGELRGVWVSGDARGPAAI